jgi:uncharacterized protein (DUF58 family)
MTARWRPSDRQRSLLTLAGLGFFLATATQRSTVAVLVVPALLLLLAPRLRRGSGAAETRIAVRGAASPDRCLEGEFVDLAVTIECADQLERVDVALLVNEGAEIAEGAAVVSSVAPRQSVRIDWRLRTTRWGSRFAGSVAVTAHRAGGLWVAQTQAAVGEVSVFPHHAPLGLLPTPRALPDRFGDHVSVVAGEGVEFIDVHDYQPGQRARRINWRATARRGALQVNRTAAERACDVVVLIDAFTDVGGRERSSLDVAVRGAVATARAYLARHDRVGLVVLGGRLIWLRPEVGGRQFYRIIEQILDVRRASAGDRPELAVIPPSALPTAALALLFSPLLDPRATTAVDALRRRGLTPVVVDVRTAAPKLQPDVPNSELAKRLWRVEHRLQLQALEDSGVPILGWDGDDLLDVAFSKLPQRRRPA